MKNTFKAIFAILTVVFVALTLYYLRTILTYILISAVLSLLGQPVYNKLLKVKILKKNIPKGICAVLTILLFFTTILAFIGFLLPLIITEINVIYSLDYGKLSNDLKQPLATINNYLQQYNITKQGETINSIVTKSISQFLNIANIAGIFSTIFGMLGNIFAAIFSIAFMSFFFLIEPDLFYNTVSFFIPARFKNNLQHIIQSVQTLLTRYFLGVALEIVLVMLIVSSCLWIVGIDNALLIGFFAGVMNVIPYIGPIISMVFAIFIAISTHLEFGLSSDLLTIAVKVIAVSMTAQFIDNNFLQPIIYSNSIKAHPLEIFLVVWISGTIGGIGGMVVGIPIYTILRVIVQELYHEFYVIKNN